MKGFAWALILGLAFFSPGMPSALAQLEVEVIHSCREIIANDPTLEPEVREIALNEVVPKIEAAVTEQESASPEARAELQIVEKTAAVIHDTTETTKKALENPEAVTRGTVEALTKSGVPAEVAGRVEIQMRDALAKAKETLKAGGTVEDVSKYFETCKAAMAEASGYLGDKNLREVFAGRVGSDVRVGGDNPEIRFVGRVIDPTQQVDTVRAAISAHFESSFQEAMARTATEGFAGPPREMMEKMMAAGINPREVMSAGSREMMGPPKEVLEAMTPEQRAAMETQMREMGTQMETQYREIAGTTTEAVYKEAYTIENQNYDNTQQVNQQNQTEVLVVSHDHNNDGLMDEFHYDVNADGIADHAHATPH
ncbi:MAG: hypothetical protein HYS41_01000 [Candidatus Omnitrophica bacterium]|nr:hypothetical protein [Candidatus Omnitrophota bacterium]